MTALLRRRVLAASLALPVLALPGVLHAQGESWPTKPIRLVVPFAAGGGADLVARAISGPLAKRLGQPIIVDNRAGGGGTTGADAVAKAPADGYTLLYTTPGPQITNPYLMAKLPYDPVADLIPVARVAVVPNVLVVNKDLPVKSVKELIQYARAHPGKLNFASAGIGSSSHLAGELFKARAGIDIVHVPYRGTGPALQDLLAGNVSMAIDSIAVYRALIESGALKALGVATPERSPVLPNVPAVAEELAGFDGAPVNYISVRSGTPRAVIERLNREVNAVLDSAEVRSSLQASGVVPKGSTPQEMAAQVKSEAAKWKHVIQLSGARVE
ncbi:Bug family tripartite tricarboxylate transporter substrate binding protein [Azohydromonas lata]|uniref:Tripartite tricarboxylate transporter substrate binding protein n=1 Tax=Azohydromonas lata TaxID=45677 RepID=A0ABU5ICK0_9BURK|nr:tripartite tricarboxylate transporter substrate binding protein [Azohydromonas lata]MDZ5456814.1 tripartite tricarboxylate transporter substrate binding protein [Azohydromonas lata]